MADTARRKTKKDQQVNLENLGLEIGNKPPQALDVEEAVLGAMLLEPNCVDFALSELDRNAFYDPKHKLIFDAISELVKENISTDIITVRARLKQHGTLDEVGGPAALALLSEKVASAAHIEYYVKILKQKTIQRDLISASYRILNDAFDDSVKVDDLVDIAQSKIFEAIQSNMGHRDVQDIATVVGAAMNELTKMQKEEGVHGVPSGFPSLDAVTNGWQPSDLVILAARPSVGKTAFALNIARNAAVDHHKPVAVFSLEMSALQLANRLITTETELPAEKIKGIQKLEPCEWVQLETKIKPLISAPLYIDDTPGLQIMEFRTKAKNLVKNKKVSLIIVDYLQLMQGPADLRGMREQEVAAISRALKATAKELNVPIIALSQLSRQAVQRQGAGGKPQLSDLRESGSIEQDADMVLFIHRPDYVGLSENKEDREKTQLIIAKHRNGDTCDINMLFKGERIRFIEETDALDIQARSYDSAMNSIPADNYGDMPSDFGNPVDF